MPVKKKPVAKKAAKKKTVAKKKAAASKKKAVAKKVAKKKTAKKAATKKAASKKTTAKKTAKKAAAKKAVTKKAAGKKTAGKKTSAKKTGTGKAAAKKSAGGKGKQGFEPYKLVKGEDYMNEAHVAHFNKLLQDWKHELMEEVDRTVHHMQDEAANFPDPNDRATQESEFTIELRTRDRERKLIKKIDEALDLLEAGEYGYCEQCGMEIGIRRLEARPTATLCIDCKSLDEIRERQRG